MRYQWILVVILLGSVGCAKQQYGQCEAPDDALTVMFKAKNKAHPFSHSFCIVCNTEIEKDEYNAWFKEMGGDGLPDDLTPDQLDKVTPCLYVYSGEPKNIGSFDECVSLVCDGTAEYNDSVSKSNGNFNLDPIFDGTAPISIEDDLLTNQEGTLISRPMGQEFLPDSDRLLTR